MSDTTQLEGDAMEATHRAVDREQLHAARAALAQFAAGLNPELATERFALDELARADDLLQGIQANVRQIHQAIAKAHVALNHPEKIFPIAADIAAEINGSEADPADDWKT